jgi:hypothetical protein
VISVWSVPRGYNKYKEDLLSQLSFEMPACQNMSLGINVRRSTELAVGRIIEKKWQEMNYAVRRKLHNVLQ